MTETLNQQAMAILQKNDRGGFTIPTARLYPFQWNWDSAFIALGIATYDRDRAWQELEMLTDAQADDGMIPHIIFRKDDADYFPGPSVWQTEAAGIPASGISQPPVLASIVRHLVETAPASELARADSLFEPMLRWQRWYFHYRRPDGCPAICTVHPWETGRDNCPDWDIGMQAMAVDPELPSYTRKDIEHADPSQRPSHEEYDKYITMVKFGRDHNWDQSVIVNDGPFLMADPGLHFIWLRACRDLREIAVWLGKDDVLPEIDSWIEAGIAGADYFWNDAIQAYCVRDVRSGTFSNGFSNASALCFYADVGSELQRSQTLDHIRRIAKQTKFGQPSWDPEAARFESQRYWCGPLWCQMNYMISKGLAEQDIPDLAEKMRLDLRHVIELSGFYECFDPMSGAGCIGQDFSWTAALWLAWAGYDAPAIQAA